MNQNSLAWLNKTFLASVLQGERSEVTIKTFNVSQAVAAGNNYMSHLYRVRVEYTVNNGSDPQVTSLIIKMPISTGGITEVIDSSEFYAKEPRTYKELLPRLNKLVKCEFGPTFFSCPITNGLILKDMIEEGYVMCDKFKQLDFSYCKSVYLNMAKFHASTVACYHNHPELIKELGKDIMQSKVEMMESFTKPSIMYLAKVLSQIEGCEQAVELILSRIDSITRSVIDLCQPKISGLNVLNHGDMWINNILFKTLDSGEVEDVKFIDFQMLRWGSPATDLLYFFWTSANEDVRGQGQKELYALYRNTLNSTLEELGCSERLSEQELEDDIQAASDFVLFIICRILPFILSESEDAVSMEGLSVDDFKTIDMFEHLYNSKRYKAILPKMMEQFQEWIASFAFKQ